MITVLPVEDIEIKKSLYAKHMLKCASTSMAVSASDGDKQLGYGLFDLNDERFLLYVLEPMDDKWLADGVLRSALHVSHHRGIDWAFYDEIAPVELIRSLGFIENDEKQTLDIGKLFSSCRNC